MSSKRIINEKFGRLLVLRFSHSAKQKRFWVCLCDCGNTVQVSTVDLRAHRKQSCGCLKTETSRRLIQKLLQTTKEETAFNEFYGTYAHNAANAGFEFPFSKERFKELTQKNCTYCGDPPSYVYQKRRNGGYLSNGLDRINSSAGYSEENVVTCCRWCNRMKMDFSVDEFKNHIFKIHNNLRDMK